MDAREMFEEVLKAIDDAVNIEAERICRNAKHDIQESLRHYATLPEGALDFVLEGKEEVKKTVMRGLMQHLITDVHITIQKQNRA